MACLHGSQSSATTDHPRVRSTCASISLLASLRSLSLYDCELHRAPRCYSLDVDDRPIAFCACCRCRCRVLERSEAIDRISRVVVLPGLQQMRARSGLIESLGCSLCAPDRRFMATTRPHQKAHRRASPETGHYGRESALRRSGPHDLEVRAVSTLRVCSSIQPPLERRTPSVCCRG